ncbi:hypothetical protein [Reichenbachiella versicolor]|uniref:hypothetical protein n=1 Tax=Reichenbachiella versicolor TaxID=1821036 RepID=UPI000D6E81A2|nr:hypothetical protein [Reichenbachiella versicolor]
MTPSQIAKIIISTLSLVLLFHLSIVTGVVPFDMVWGGRLKTVQEMYAFELFSIAINLIMIAIVSMKVGFINQLLSPVLVTVFLWIFVGLFALNTVGNLFSLNSLEAMIFTPITFVLSILFFLLARSK